MIKKYLAVAVAFVFIGSGMAQAHQPVFLLNTDTTPDKGPLLADGTISFAIGATFTKSGQKKAFRAKFKDGDALSIQYLIVDKKPESSLRITALPSLVVTSPMGASVTIKLNERTKFFEPFSKVNYLYLARYNAMAQAGVYSFVITSKGKAGITVAVGDREVRGEVLRGPAPKQTPTQTSSPSSTSEVKPTIEPAPAPSDEPKPLPTLCSSTVKTNCVAPTPSKSPAAAQSSSGPSFSLAEVKKNNNSANCWTIVDDNVYNLTTWINAHPGGSNAILSLCGVDGTSAFKSQHAGRAMPVGQLDSLKIGTLK